MNTKLLESNLHLIQFNKMFLSQDVLLDNKYKVHIGVAPKLGFIIVSQLDDFAEDWLEIKVVENSRYRLQYDIRTYSGSRVDGLLEAACRSFVDKLHDNLHKKSGPSAEQIGSSLKFILNVGLEQDILNNRSYIISLGNSLGSMVDLQRDFH